MFNLSEKHSYDRPIFKCDYITCTSLSLNLVDGENNQSLFDKPRQDSTIPLKDSYLKLDFNVTHRADAHDRYVNGDQTILVNLGRVTLSSKYRVTRSSGKEKKKLTKLMLMFNVQINIK